MLRTSLEISIPVLKTIILNYANDKIPAIPARNSLNLTMFLKENTNTFIISSEIQLKNERLNESYGVLLVNVIMEHYRRKNGQI